MTGKVAEGAANRVQVVPRKKSLRAKAVEAGPNPVPVALARAVKREPRPVPIVPGRAVEAALNPVPVVLAKAVEAGRNSAGGTIRSSQFFRAA